MKSKIIYLAKLVHDSRKAYKSGKSKISILMEIEINNQTVNKYFINIHLSNLIFNPQTWPRDADNLNVTYPEYMEMYNKKISEAFPGLLSCLENGINYGDALGGVTAAYRLGHVDAQYLAEIYNELCELEFIRDLLSETEEDAQTDEWFLARRKLGARRDEIKSFFNCRFHRQV